MGPRHPAALPRAAREAGNYWDPRDPGFPAPARKRVPSSAARCLASCSGPRAGTRTVGAREACELHLNGRPARGARRAGVWAAGTGREAGGARRKRGRAPAFCNLLRLLPRLARGSGLRGKEVTEGGVWGSVPEQWDSEDAGWRRGGGGGGEQSQDSLPTQSGNSDFEPGGCCGSFCKLEMLQEARGADLGGRESRGSP